MPWAAPTKKGATSKLDPPVIGAAAAPAKTAEPVNPKLPIAVATISLANKAPLSMALPKPSSLYRSDTSSIPFVKLALLSEGLYLLMSSF